MQQTAQLLFKFTESLWQRGPWETASRTLGWLRERFRVLKLRMTVLRDDDPAAVFTKIYRTGFWGNSESVSGPGSTLAFTESLRAELPQLMRRMNVRQVVDAPCGDFNWAQHVFPSSGVGYVGGDIVAPLVARNQERYGSPTVRFMEIDITRTPLPDADIWICRDCLFHLSFDLIFAALDNFAKSNVGYMLTTTHIRDFQIENRDIRTGDFRLIDLFAPPFNLPRDPVAFIDDSHGDDQRRMVLWSREQVRTALTRGRTPLAPETLANS